MGEFTEIWTYLSSEPLWWLTATLGAYCIGDLAFRASGRRALVNPVLISVLILAALLFATGTDYPTYFEGAKFIHFMLGPATVCLAVPLYFHLGEVKRALVPIAVALLVGSFMAVGSVVVLGQAFGLSGETILSLMPKSATAPVAMGISENIGGLPTLTAVLVILTGITGAIVVTPLMTLLGIKDFRARGFAVGLTSHGIGTARALQVDETAGAFAGIGMGLNALATAILVPLILVLF
ncbi:MAG: LrgB family protein [Pseudomonadota bacterium]